MKINGLSAFLEAELAYPVDQAAVVERVGATEIEGANDGETETISAIIDAVGQDTYWSADELYTTIVGNVSDDYIGRKFYDDRGGNPAEVGSAPRDEDNVSF